MVYLVPLLVPSQKARRQSHSSTIFLFLISGACLGGYLSYSGRNSISFKLPLSKYTLGIFVNLYSSTASMSKQFATIYTPYTSKKVEFIDNYVFAFLAIFLVLVYIRSYAFLFVKVQTLFLNKEVLTLYNF